MANSSARKDSAYDDEIVALLHQVGQRLITSEQDRKELKHAMDDLVEKADQGERAFLTIQDRISKTESALEKRQKAIEQTLKSQEERIERATAVALQLEEAIAQHAKINRRLDKVAQDKARMIRKLERIEEAVIETHEALNAKALSMLAAKEDSAEDSFKAWLPQAPAANDRQEETDRPWWRQHGPVRVGAVAAMVLLGVAGGWAVTTMQMKAPARQALLESTAMSGRVADAAPPPAENLAAYEERESPGNEQFAAAIEQALAEDPAAATPPHTPEAAAEPAAEPSPVDMTDDQLLASLNNDPDALAARLNDIVTGSGPAAAASEELDEAAPAPAPKTEKAAFTPPKQEIREVTTAEFIKSQREAKPLAARIAPDPGLPSVIKEVEKKAYEGLAEAQHDLAAIYTAGHGGVKVDYAKAAAWFRESAIQGVANARYNLGVLYHQGLGVEKDINTAVSWYRAAAEEGHPEAQYNLGIAYIEGIGTRYDPQQASVYFEKAAKQGILEAAYNLGLIHENGLTGDARPDEALYWYKQAADLGSPEAKIAMDQLAKTLGLFPEEVERLYSKTKKDDKASAPAPESAPRQAAVSAPQPAETPDEADVEYLEAQPLNDTPALAAAATDRAGSSSSFQEDQAITAQIQEQLIRLGLYPGPADGLNDNLTTDAIRAYQANNSLKADGRPSQALLVHMMTSEMGENEFGSRAE